MKSSETTVEMTRLPIHLGVYWHGVARRVEGGVMMRSSFGPYVEQIAESVDRLTLLSHDPPADADRGEVLADYHSRPTRDNIEVLSLGSFGSRRDYLRRMGRITRVVGPASEGWDALLMRFSRRSNLVLRANRCPRLIALVYQASMPLGVRSLIDTRNPRKVALALRSQWHLRRFLEHAGFATTDGEACQRSYQHLTPSGEMLLLRHSSRSGRYAHRVEDRLNGADVRFLFVGHITENKGIFDAIEAFRLLKADFPRATLHVAGIGPALDDARRRVKEAGLTEAVVFRGWVPIGEELFELYRRSDVLLFTSRSVAESIPRVVSEAWAHSVLVVATPVGSLPLAYEDGRELLFVPVRDPRAVAEAVRMLSEDQNFRRSMLHAAYQRAKESTLEVVVDALMGQVALRWPELAETQPSETP